MDKYAIISLKKKGVSNRQIEKELHINRKTIARVWNTYRAAEQLIVSSTTTSKEETDKLIRNIVHSSYDSSSRTRRKLTPSVKQRIHQILEEEEEKTKLLGQHHKQRLTTKQIVEILHTDNIDIGHTTVNNYIRKIKQSKIVFIRQEYSFGDRLEYDFGEVKLMIGDVLKVFYLAVLAAPASGYRWAYLYPTQSQSAFLDSHVQFFSMLQGGYKEVVYDNMRNVVSQFIGKHEKRLNENLINLALYYGFDINVTNCFSGNEKGFVEGSVKKIRNFVFAKEYAFASLESAREYLQQQLQILNQESKIEEEKEYLLPHRPPYELAQIEEVTVNKYSCIQVDNNFYSIPDYLTDKKVTVKKYIETLVIYSHHEFVCEHKKIDGYGEYQLILSHYLHTLSRKPGALKHSKVLKQYPALKTIYQEYYKTKPKEFISIILQHKEKELPEIIQYLKAGPIPKTGVTDSLQQEIIKQSQEQLQRINEMYGMGGNDYGTH